MHTFQVFIAIVCMREYSTLLAYSRFFYLTPISIDSKKKKKKKIAHR